MSKKSMKQFNAKNTAPKKVVKPNNRKVAEWVLAILILIWTIGTVLGVVGFVRTLPKASADESSSTVISVDRKSSLTPNPSSINDWVVPLPFLDGFSYSPGNNSLFTYGTLGGTFSCI